MIWFKKINFFKTANYSLFLAKVTKQASLWEL